MRKFLPAILSMLFLTACTAEVELDLGQKERPSVVVEGFLTDSSEAPQWIRVTYTTSYYNTEDVPPVDNANVTLVEGGTYYDLQQNADPDSSSYYHAPSSFDPKVGEEYRLEIDHEDSLYTSSSKVRPVIDIDSIHLRLRPFQNAQQQQQEEGEIDTTFQVVAHFDELAQPGHYLFNLYAGGELISDEANEKVVFDAEGGREIVAAVQSFEKNEVELGDMLVLTARSVSPACEEFYDIFRDQTQLSGNPFAAAPPANIPTNISGSALGFFQVSKENVHKRLVGPQLLKNVEIPGDGP